nr:type II secretion system F family protein [uncultured Noviherbaspirillum sp.]
MMSDTVLLGLGVFALVLALVEGLRCGAGLLDAAAPAASRLQKRLRDVTAPARAAASIARQGQLADAPLLRRFLERFVFSGGVERLLSQAGMRIKVAPFLLLSVGLAGLPALLALHLRRRRMACMERQLPDALDLLGQALRAGHALPSALRMAAEDDAAPLADEFRKLVDEVAYGAALPEALRRMAARNPGGDIGCFVVAVLIQRDTGGNLAELLAGIAALVRERQKLRGQVRVATAEARLSAWILGLLPFVLAAALHLAHPGFISLLWTDPAGRRLLCVVAALLVAGLVWMRMLVRIQP